MIRVILVIVLLAAGSVSSLAEQITITDSNNNKVLLINTSKELSRFKYFWSQKRPTRKHQNYKWRYQLIIDDATGKSTWVYDPQGYARKISMDESTVIFQLTSVRSFNRFLNKG